MNEMSRIGVNSLTTVRTWILAIRPKTLSAAWVPVLLGSALAKRLHGNWNAKIAIMALASSLLIQVATNLFNDALDFKKGADGAQRLGPTRVTASGMASPKAVFLAGWISLTLALIFGVPLIIEGGLPIFALGVVSLFLAYGYTGGPFPLAYLGLGDLFVYLFFGLIAVGGTFFLQTQTLRPAIPVLVAASQIGLWATALIAINNFRDSAEDLRNHKLTLSARLGARFSRIEITSLLIFPFVLGLGYWPVNQGAWSAGILPMLAFPLAVRISYDVWKTDPSPHYNDHLARAGVTHLLAGLLLSIGMVL
ncbi:MAG: 1,4-dihydroxy-2-naphthoate octaprenyltransferase [Pseudomonadota bacterium]|jgi:1,4-dihydroxy-2-naphthoate octaprenyltransferase